MFLSEKLENIVRQTDAGVKMISGKTIEDIRKAQHAYISDQAMKMVVACVENAIEKSPGSDKQASIPQLKRVNLEFKRILAKHPYLPVKKNVLEKFLEENYGIVL
jgi:vacuolar-type H+-ATPase subunit F/Vma7